MKAYVLNKNKEPLMPTTPAIARILLKEGKAKVVRKTPFTIQLLADSAEFKQPVTGGVDIGCVHLGCAAVSGKNVLYTSQTLLNDSYTVKQKIGRRRGFRRARRSKLRYRKPPFSRRVMVRLRLQHAVKGLKAAEKAALYPKFSLKKKLSFDQETSFVAPSVRAKVDHHFDEMKFVEKILPVTEWKVETANFDIHKITDPSVKGKKYQKGEQLGYYNVKAYVLSRDKHKCYYCGASGLKTEKRAAVGLSVHHFIQQKFDNSTDDPDNLITLCDKCHRLLHEGKIAIEKPAKKKKDKQSPTLTNTVRSQLVKRLTGKNFTLTYGYETKYKRQVVLGLPKDHHFDAIAIASDGSGKVILDDTLYRKRRVAKGDYKLERRRKKTETSGKTYPERPARGRYKGYRRWDYIKSAIGKGYVHYMSKEGNTLTICDIDGKTLFTISRNAKPKILRAGRSVVTSVEKISQGG